MLVLIGCVLTAVVIKFFYKKYSFTSKRLLKANSIMKPLTDATSMPCYVDWVIFVAPSGKTLLRQFPRNSVKLLTFNDYKQLYMSQLKLWL